MSRLLRINRGSRRCLFAVALVCVALAACHRPRTPQERIAERVKAIAHAAEQRKTGDILKYIDDNYRDPYGSVKQDVRGILAQYFFQHPRIGAYLIGVDTQLGAQGQTAHSIVKLALTSGAVIERVTDIVPKDGRAYLFEVDWRLDGEEWLITSAEYRLLTVEELL